ncbi:malonyl-ACP O-methyltransferase BioC [Acinetobacter sp. MD2(2019)]|uniref:malonyl-ACP O-methyltransferase BioC n=1 Tax=Acinetobacter sp. MD2(2019) TaxID=2605273 RepID=UPI002D1F25F2|nr:malonyl-ACP O-methyltransferase BioC [Acinetobacter sp. MD2(2019)]MEB3753944.1 malonyl-ACP O-methyltransferase BioC [Acinetobacter sp. MD2(2019)]
MHIDKSKVQQRFARAKYSYTEQAIAQQQICQHLSALIQQYCPTPLKKVFEIGCGSGNLTHLLLPQLQIEQYIVNDLYPAVMEFFKHDANVDFCLGDAETIVYPKQLTAIVSSSALQWMQDLNHVFAKIHQALHSQGWFCFSIFGPENLKEIKALTGQGLSYHSAEQITTLLQQQGFEVLHTEQHSIQLMFSHPLRVLKHLKATGVTASSHHFVWTKQRLKQFDQDYAQFSQINDQGVSYYPLTYHPIYIIARRTV